MRSKLEAPAVLNVSGVNSSSLMPAPSNPSAAKKPRRVGQPRSDSDGSVQGNGANAKITKSGAAKRRGAVQARRAAASGLIAFDRAELSQIAGGNVGDIRPGQKVDANHATRAGTDLICSRLMALQRRRIFCIKSQSRQDRSIEAQLAISIGLPPNLRDWKNRTKAERDAWKEAAAPIFKQAAAFRKNVEKAGEVQNRPADQPGRDLAGWIPMILCSKIARSAFDKMRIDIEKEMRDTASALPVWNEFRQVAGFGPLGLAVVIAELGNPSYYATKERVWKRLGLAVINGERQQRKTGPEAEAHGYSPRRRAEIWWIADTLLYAQWRGEKDGMPAHPIGKYGEIYGRRREHTASREGWTKDHCNNDAKRIMSKALVKDVWKAWRRCEGGKHG